MRLVDSIDASVAVTERMFVFVAGARAVEAARREMFVSLS